MAEEYIQTRIAAERIGVSQVYVRQLAARFKAGDKRHQMRSVPFDKREIHVSAKDVEAYRKRKWGK